MNGFNSRSLHHTGKPRENGYTESLNGHIRDECLNEHVFHAPRLIAAWRDDYNNVRSHGSIGNMPPTAYHVSLLSTLAVEQPAACPQTKT